MTDAGDSRSWRAVLGAGAGSGEALALGVDLRHRVGAADAFWQSRRVRSAEAADVVADPRGLLLSVRPLVRSAASGSWIRADVGWELLRRGSARFDRAQVQWFSELFGIARDASVLGGFDGDAGWLSLESVSSALLWPHLADAERFGIPIVGARQAVHVERVAEADVVVHVSSAPDGALRVEARAQVGGGGARSADGREAAEVVRPLGAGAVYAVRVESPSVGSRIDIRFAPAAHGAAARALLQQGAVTVPADEVEEFARAALPALSQGERLRTAPGTRLPRPPRTMLEVSADFRRPGRVDVALNWRAASGERSVWEQPPDDVDAARRHRVEAVWRAEGLDFAPRSSADGAEAAVFADRMLDALAALPQTVIEVLGERPRHRELRGDPRVRLNAVESTDADWFELGVIVEIDGRRIPFRPLFTALSLRRTRMLLSDGAYFSLAHPALERLRTLIDESSDLVEWESGPRISRAQLPFFAEFEDFADELPAVQAWRDAARALLHEVEGSADAARAAAPGGHVVAELRPYQRAGLERLLLLHRHGLGGVLADDMGLGKTLQLLAMLAAVRADAPTAPPALVLAPTSVLGAWREQAERFTPGLRVHVADRVGALSHVEADVVLTSYTVLRLDADAYAARAWSSVILDEAQAVKNPRTAVHRAVARLRADAMFAATGTPLENSLAELWAILSLVTPGLFPSARRFRQAYIGPIERGKVAENHEGGASRAAVLARLRRRLAPFVIRRTKAQVAPELPPRAVQVVRVELSAAHRAVYDRVLQRERKKILGLLDDLDAQRFIVFRSITLLRMLALDPSLVDAGGPVHAGKLEVLAARIEELRREGRRALVFSQFTSYLALAAADLAARGIDAEWLDGSTRGRAAVVERFRTGTAPVFLISLKAGGVGLTLTEADVVFLLDPWWNPAVEQQAIDRVHRIGQTQPVHVYRLIAAGTIEEKVLQLQARKERLFDAVMRGDDAAVRALDADDIRALLAP